MVKKNFPLKVSSYERFNIHFQKDFRFYVTKTPMSSVLKFIEESIGLWLSLELERKANEIICMHVSLNDNIDCPHTLY